MRKGISDLVSQAKETHPTDHLTPQETGCTNSLLILFLLSSCSFTRNDGTVCTNSSENRCIIYRGGTNRIFVKPCFCPLPKGAVLTKTAKMTNLHSTHCKQGLRSLDLRKRGKMTTMAGVTQAKAWFRKGSNTMALMGGFPFLNGPFSNL